MPTAKYKTQESWGLICFFTIVSPRPQRRLSINGVARAAVFHMRVIQLSVNLGINRLFLPILFLQETGLYKYKVFGTLKDCPPALLIDVYMDLDYRKQWDQNVEGKWHLLFLKTHLERRIYCYLFQPVESDRFNLYYIMFPFSFWQESLKSWADMCLCSS